MNLSRRLILRRNFISIENVNRMSQSKFRRRACGFEIHADINGALNVMRGR